MGKRTMEELSGIAGVVFTGPKKIATASAYRPEKTHHKMQAAYATYLRKRERERMVRKSGRMKHDDDHEDSQQKRMRERVEQEGTPSRSRQTCATFFAVSEGVTARGE